MERHCRQTHTTVVVIHGMLDEAAQYFGAPDGLHNAAAFSNGWGIPRGRSGTTDLVSGEDL